ncbi:MAG: methyl-accepting chemotaxis sensory transducer with Cache sensor [Firmicutes bacterium]|nr:methyl-accepting chemotaxis sensory transducer with Cache sensor [Bacillota bacterium]
MKSMNARLIALIVVFAFISATLVGAVNMYLSVNSTMSKMLENNQTIASQLSSEIERFMIDVKGMVEAMAVSPTSYSMDGVKIREMILAIQQKNPQFELIFVMDVTGQQIARTSGNLANRADRAYFKEAMKGTTYFTDTYISAFTNAPTITISTPIKNPAGQIIGVFAADVSLKALADISEQIKIGQTGYVDIVDNKGTLIAHPVKERVLKNENVAELPYIKEVMGGKLGSTEGVSSTGISSLVAFAPMKMLGWGMVTYQPKSEITSVITKNLEITLVLIVVTVLLAGIAAIYVVKNMVKPLELLAAAAEQMAGGNLRQVIATQGVAEINHLAESLESMRHGLQSIVSNIMRSSEQVAASAEELTAVSEQCSQATNQVAHSITDVAEGVQRQNQAIDSTAAVTEEISASIEEIAANASQVADMTDRTMESATTGKKSVDAAVSQMEKIEDVVSRSADIVALLGDNSKKIGEIINTITGIANQTNLLALNAAIEAARAGEQGRGFAVVAEEVRKLAEGSEAAAKQIGEIITEIQSETEQAVIAMTAGSQEVRVGAEVVNSAGVAFHDITCQLGEVLSQIKGITSAIQEMAKGSQQIVTSIRDIDQVSQHTAQQAETVSAATEEQSAAMDEISSSSQALSNLAVELQGTIRQFKI